MRRSTPSLQRSLRRKALTSISSYSYLGYELYYELSSQPAGKALEQDSSSYRKIIKMSEELYTRFNNDKQILQKKAKEINI